MRVGIATLHQYDGFVARHNGLLATSTLEVSESFFVKVLLFQLSRIETKNCPYCMG